MTHELADKLRKLSVELRVPIKTPLVGQVFGDIATQRNVAIAENYEAAADELDRLSAPVLPGEIEAIRTRRAAIDGSPWKYEKIGQTVFGRSAGGCNMEVSDYMVANIRGWGHLQYKGDERGDTKAQALQDANGQFISSAPDDMDTLLRALEAKTRECEELRKDKARLDFLEPVNIEIGFDYDNDARLVYKITGNINDREWNEIGLGRTLREAIDAALSKEPTP